MRSRPLIIWIRPGSKSGGCNISKNVIIAILFILSSTFPSWTLAIYVSPYKRFCIVFLFLIIFAYIISIKHTLKSMLTNLWILNLCICFFKRKEYPCSWKSKNENHQILIPLHKSGDKIKKYWKLISWEAINSFF